LLLIDGYRMAQVMETIAWPRRDSLKQSRFALLHYLYPTLVVGIAYRAGKRDTPSARRPETSSSPSAHLVHSDAEGHLAVVAVFFTQEPANPTLESLRQIIPAEKDKTVALSSVSVNANDPLPGPWLLRVFDIADHASLHRRRDVACPEDTCNPFEATVG
jgi:hypothetical protein